MPGLVAGAKETAMNMTDKVPIKSNKLKRLIPWHECSDTPKHRGPQDPEGGGVSCRLVGGVGQGKLPGAVSAKGITIWVCFQFGT